MTTYWPIRWKSWLEAGLAFLYPAVCQICGVLRAAADDGYVCEHCRQQVRFIRPPFCKRCGLPFEGAISTAFECGNCRNIELNFVWARSAVAAKGLARDVIHRYKYKRALWFEPFLANLLVQKAKPVLAQEKWDMILPVPLHSLKQREREFNQAERLAKRLGAAIGLPANKRILKRIIPTRTQTLLTRAERTANVRRAFAARRGSTLDGQRIVLVDDVFTTGATTDACAKALLKAGAGAVCVWTVARGI